MDLIVKDELFPSDAKFLTKFSKCKNNLLSDNGINICKRIKLTQKYYREVETNLKVKPKFIHGNKHFSH